MRSERAKTVLLVDDEPDILRMVGKFSRGEGYGVLEVESPENALALCSNPESEIDLLLSDYRMPSMNGLDLGLAIRKIRPNLPMIFMSGNLESEALLVSNGFRCLRKPFLFPEMAGLIGKALEGACGS
jgi:two-component system cell cycle sensor histidine kinase/response regulator CckA